jgi:hypothetical protein
MFDVENVAEIGIRTDLRHIAHRAGSIGQQLHFAYGTGRDSIVFRFISDYEFNAYAGKAETNYTIELNVAVPLFSIILFYRLLSYPSVLPFLSTDGATPSDFSLPFVIDPADFARRADWTVRANAIRAFAAGTIADFCSTFVVCHEFGHILSGHVEGMQHYYGADRVAEFVRSEAGTGVVTGRRQAWEYEADKVGAALAIQFVEQLATARDEEPRTKTVFSDGAGHHLEHSLAICVAALLAFFIYVQGMRTKLDRRSSHPHPYVRATYLKHMLVQAALRRGEFNLAVFDTYLDMRLDEFLAALEATGLLDGRTYTRA